MKELLFILSMLIPMLLMAIFGAWPIFWVFLAFFVCFGAIEGYYAIKMKKTVSQYFWDFSKKHKVKAIIILISMAVMWISLLLHLGMKLF